MLVKKQQQQQQKKKIIYKHLFVEEWTLLAESLVGKRSGNNTLLSRDIDNHKLHILDPKTSCVTAVTVHFNGENL